MDAIRRRLRSWRQYLAYVNRHRRFVREAAVKLGIPRLGWLHDVSKYSPDEFLAYAENFYGGHVREARPPRVKRAYDEAWLRHVRRNKHHPMRWVTHFNVATPYDYDPERPPGGFESVVMPEQYSKEMVADWDGARRAGADGAKKTTREWYEAKGAGLPLHPETRILVERWLRKLEA